MCYRLVALGFLTLALFVGCETSAPPTSRPTRVAPEINCLAPALEGVDMDGKKINLSELKGKVVVVDFWATWCGPCRDMIPHEKQLVRNMIGRPFAFIGVSTDQERKKLQSFLDANPLPWPTINEGEEPLLARAWKIQALPTFFIIDAEGIIRHRMEGGDPTLERKVEKLLKEIEAK